VNVGITIYFRNRVRAQLTVFIFGLDGASLEILGESMRRTKLANFEKILTKGTSSHLLSTYPYVTAPAWTTIFSGVNPGKHGIFDMYEIVNNAIDPSNMRTTEIPFLWDYLTWAKKKVLVVGVPFFYPAPKINGTFVTGRFVSKLSCYPEDVQSKVDFSGFEYIDLPTEENIEKVILSGSRVISARMIRDLEKRIEASTALIDSQREWDAVIIVDSLPDDSLHISFDDKQIVDEMFKSLDRYLGQILVRMRDEDSLLVVSDHGFSKVDGLIFINEWLREKQYLEFHRSLWSTVLARLGLNWDAMSKPGTVSRLYTYTLKHFPKLARTTKRFLSPGLIVNESTQLNSSKVSAFNINEPVAWIRISESEAVNSDSLASELEALKREGTLKNVYKTSEIYSGKYVSKALGQLLIEAKDGWAIDTTRWNNGRLMGKPLLTKKGIHKREGILVFCGKGKPNSFIQARIHDIVPTVLSLMNLPIPSYIDGKPLNAKENVEEWKLEVSQGL
jgi:predicted AlkP superfamily phosphohydrolase/phosphomutase